MMGGLWEDWEGDLVPRVCSFLMLALFLCLKIGLQIVKKVLIMAAIAEISSLQEWEEEWKALEEDTKKFKVLILYLK